MRGKTLWALLLSVCLLIMVSLPAMAADPEVTKKDLKGISPQHHRYLFSVVGGAAIGAGVGALLGGGNDITKGIMVGGGGMSALYLHSHRHDTLDGWRNWAYIASYTSFGGQKMRLTWGLSSKRERNTETPSTIEVRSLGSIRSQSW